ncbi:MAG: hypothetical protein J7641_23165, partial [Cyanobacteria bacterium SID2]|nr:hypothetical protein [Cyanobacteria bacterium SID2]
MASTVSSVRSSAKSRWVRWRSRSTQESPQFWLAFGLVSLGIHGLLLGLAMVQWAKPTNSSETSAKAPIEIVWVEIPVDLSDTPSLETVSSIDREVAVEEDSIATLPTTPTPIPTPVPTPVPTP